MTAKQQLEALNKTAHRIDTKEQSRRFAAESRRLKALIKEEEASR